MERPTTTGWSRLLLSFAFLALSGCVDTEQVFVDRPLFEDPPTGAQGFLGYSDQDEKLPVCGNCHIGQHADWRVTGHASAWTTLQESGGAQEFCEGCHTVGANGNLVVDENVGYAATTDPRYEDVQCEACHGPGLDHVTNPDLEASQPLASILVGADLTSGCGECHSGTHHPFLDEWAQSRHGDAGNAGFREREGCRNCHGARGVFEAWGVNTEYLEKDGTDPIGITCAVCHDPHNAENEHQLRFPIDVPEVDVNLCMKCHQRRAVPDPTSSRGPHSPQGPLLLGENVGWEPPNFVYSDVLIRGTHGTEANTRLCATCHVNSMEITDPLTGDFVFSATGHLFKPIPCLDAQGVPTAAEECDITERSFVSCTTSGCHGDETAARSAYLTATGRIANLVDELNALLAQVPASEFSTTDEVFTVAEGAKFNAGLGAITSSAVHNPFLTEALMTASIEAVESEYGLAPVSNVSLQNLLSDALN